MHVKKVVIGCLVVAVTSIGIYTVVTHIQNKNRNKVSVEFLDSATEFASEDSNISELYDSQIATKMIADYNRASKINRDVIGWIKIANTNIDYPICSGNNNFYLNRTYDKRPSKAGSIFLDENQLTFDKVSLIHGHNMLNGTMFSHLKKFTDKDIFNENNVMIYDGNNMRIFKPISILRVKENASFKYNIEDREELKKYAQELTKGTMVKNSKDITDDDIVIMNTCVSDGSRDHFILVSQEIFE